MKNHHFPKGVGVDLPKVRGRCDQGNKKSSKGSRKRFVLIWFSLSSHQRSIHSCLSWDPVEDKWKTQVVLNSLGVDYPNLHDIKGLDAGMCGF